MSSAQDPNFHIYLCFGQSNMEGNGTIESQDKTGVDARFRVMGAVTCNLNGKTYTKGVWQTATPPLVRCNTGLGPSDYFGRTMVANLPTNIKVGVVPVAIGGCDIALFDKVNYASYVATAPSWMVGTINEYGGNPYARLVEVAKLAQKDGVIKGILLHQGETNSGQTTWPSKVKAIYDNLIKDLGLDAKSVPLLVGELVTTAMGGACGGHNSIIATVPNVIPNSYVISASSLAHKGDNLHFTPAAYRVLGERYAQKMLSLLPSSTGSSPTISFTSPANNASFTQGTSITLTASASDADGSIASVKFYDGSTLLSTDNTSPYSFTWTNASAGSHTIKGVATDNSGNTTEVSIIIKVNVAQAPYGGTAWGIPGVIQLENYDVGGNKVAYYDSTAGSEVSPVVNFRTDEDVDIETCTDVGGGYNIGYATKGEWLEYTVKVNNTATYDLDLRVACNGTGRTVSVSMDGVNIASNVAIPNTGGWQTWQTVTVSGIPLTAGQKVMRLTVGNTDYVNLNYVEYKVVTDVEEHLSQNQLNISPNPFDENGINVHGHEGSKYKITSVAGVELENGFLRDNVSVAKQLPIGTYLLTLENGKTSKTVLVIRK
ncbi:MAG: sialate O-acetylesterase [Cytophagales bacterium]